MTLGPIQPSAPLQPPVAGELSLPPLGADATAPPSAGDSPPPQGAGGDTFQGGEGLPAGDRLPYLPGHGHHWPYPSASPAELAKYGYAAMMEASSAEEQCRVGLKYSRDILYAATTKNEQAVAYSTLNAYSQLGSMTSAVNLFYTTFGAVASGIPGPLGPAVGKVAMKAMEVADGSVDKCAIGLNYAATLQQNTSGVEQKLLDATMTAYGALGSASSGVGLLTTVFKAMNPWGYHMTEVVFGKTGYDAMGAVASSRDKCRIGCTFTKAVLDNTASPGEKAWAQYILDEYAKTTDTGKAVELLKNYLVKFTYPTPPYPVTSAPLPPPKPEDPAAAAPPA